MAQVMLYFYDYDKLVYSGSDFVLRVFYERLYSREDGKKEY